MLSLSVLRIAWLRAEKEKARAENPKEFTKA